jgi:hypothetical protein
MQNASDASLHGNAAPLHPLSRFSRHQDPKAKQGRMRDAFSAPVFVAQRNTLQQFAVIDPALRLSM